METTDERPAAAGRPGTSGSHRAPEVGPRWLLYVVCFCTGAATLVIEVSGNRLLAPLFGNSLYTWTALIGVVLVAMSVGDLVGGLLVDRAPRTSILGYLLLAAAAWTLLVPAIHRMLPATTAAAGVISGPLIASLALFAIPACLLASASPFIVRLISRITEDHEIGRSAGVVGMLSTLGSFVGTFVTGFWLIPQFGVRAIFLMTGVVVAALGATVLATGRGSGVRRAVALLAVAGIAAASLCVTPAPVSGLLHEQQTFYHDVRVEEWTTEYGERVRGLKLDTTLEGGQYVETGNVFMPCNLYWRLAEEYGPRLERALFLGGGGFGMPEDFSRRHPHAAADVVELDPAVIDVGRRFFRLGEFSAVRPIAADARRFLVGSDATYDMIFCDAYHGLRNIPAHLVTREFFALVKARLAEDGVFLANVISPVTGDRADVFRSLLRTIRTEFPHTEAYSVANLPLDGANNVIIMAANRPFSRRTDTPPDDVTAFLLSTRIDPATYEPLGGVVFTDDHNPSEYFVARQVGSVD
jgi:predicted membrane-bound spermidine synthase